MYSHCFPISAFDERKDLGEITESGLANIRRRSPDFTREFIPLLHTFKQCIFSDYYGEKSQFFLSEWFLLIQEKNLQFIRE